MELLSEMSYGMFGPGGECFLNTYRAKRELKILYFDGYTGMISGGGRDAQDALLYGEVKDDDRGHGNGTREGLLEGEYRRARDLCRWAKELQSGVDGFVRMISGLSVFSFYIFVRVWWLGREGSKLILGGSELIWCDFEVGIELVSRLNVTIPSPEDEELEPLDEGRPPWPPEDECPTPGDGENPLEEYEEHRSCRQRWWPGRDNLWGHGGLSKREPPFPPPEDKGPSPRYEEHRYQREHGGHPPRGPRNDNPPRWGHCPPRGQDPPLKHGDHDRPGDAQPPRRCHKKGEHPPCPPDRSPSPGGGCQRKSREDHPPPGYPHHPNSLAIESRWEWIRSATWVI